MKKNERLVKSKKAKGSVAVRRSAGRTGDAQDVRALLEDSEARYRLLVKHSSDGVFLFNPRTLKILEANASFLKITGFREEEITGSHCSISRP